MIAPKKIIQIAVDSDKVEERLYALYDDGTIWVRRFRTDGVEWEPVPPPQEDEEVP